MMPYVGCRGRGAQEQCRAMGLGSMWGLRKEVTRWGRALKRMAVTRAKVQRPGNPAGGEGPGLPGMAGV